MVNINKNRVMFSRMKSWKWVKVERMGSFCKAVYLAMEL